MIKLKGHSRNKLTEHVTIRSMIALTEKIINVDGHVRKLVVILAMNHV